MKTLASPQNQNSELVFSSRVGLGVSIALHLAALAMFFDVFKYLDIKQDGDNITTIALATFQMPSNDIEIENPQPRPIKPHKKKHHRKEIVKENGKLAKKEEEIIPPSKSPNAKPDEMRNEGEMIQTLSYRSGSDDELFSRIKRAIDRKNKYPPMAQKRGLEGEVIVEFVIYKDGRVANIRIVKGCPHDLFNVAAVNAIKKAQREFPTLQVTTKVEIPIVYELKRI